MMGNMKKLPNAITVIRIILSPFLIFAPLPAFYVLYTLCSVSDMLDGFMARKLGAATDFGARLDSAADLIFCVCAFVRLLPYAYGVPAWMWFGAAFSALIRITAYIVGAVKFKRFTAAHTVMNKITGALLFGLAYTVGLDIFPICCAVCCAAAIISALEELIIVSIGGN